MLLSCVFVPVCVCCIVLACCLFVVLVLLLLLLRIMLLLGQTKKPITKTNVYTHSQNNRSICAVVVCCVCLSCVFPYVSCCFEVGCCLFSVLVLLLLLL